MEPGGDGAGRILARERLAALRAAALLDQPADPALDRFTRLAARMLKAPVSLLSLVDDDRQFFASAFGLAEPWASRRQTPLTHSFCQHVVADRSALVVEDAREHPVLRSNLAVPDLGVVAYAGVPLREPGGEVLGAFCVIDGEPHAWTDADLEVLADLAEAVTTELHLRQQAARAAALVASVPVVTFDLDPATGAVTALDGAVTALLGVERGVLLSDPARWEALVDPADRPAVLAARRTAARGDAAAVAYRLRPASGSWLWVQETVGRGASGGVHGAIIDVTPQRQLAQRLEAQNRVALALAVAEDEAQAAAEVLLHLGESFGWEVGNVWLASPAGDELLRTAWWRAPGGAGEGFTEVSGRLRFGRGVGLPGSCWAEARPIWVRDVLASPTFARREAAARDELHAAVAFPVLRAGAAEGVIEFFSHEIRDPDPGLLEVTRAIGSQLGQALERLRSLAELRSSRAHYERVARTFQRSLVPAEPPPIPGLGVATRFRPAGEGGIVGGDFLDLFRLADGRWAASIGDVCGKGSEAAAVTSLVRHSLRGAALGGAGPAAALEVANQVLLAEALGERFCTAVLAEVTPAEGGARVVLANAGHPDALVVRRCGTVEACPSRGRVLGAFPDIEGEDVAVELGPGDALVLATDGYAEASGADGDFGEERLRAALAAAAGGTAEDLAAALDRAVAGYEDGRRLDDRALVVLTAG